MALLDSCFLHLRSAFDKFHKKLKKKKKKTCRSTPVGISKLSTKWLENQKRSNVNAYKK